MPVASAQEATASKPAPLHTDIARLLDVWLEARAAYQQLPSLSVALVKGDETVYARSFGHVDRERKVPATPDTLYSICSISKLFTSIAVMRLVEEGKLALDDELTAHVPEFKARQADPSSGPVTLRGLLMHASGLPRELAGDQWTAPMFLFPDRAALLARLASEDMQERSLSHLQYSNLGMALLGEVVARRSGMTYEAYVQSAILTPLGLTRTAPMIPDARRGQDLAVGFGARKRDGTRDQMPAFDTRGYVPAAGFSASVNDLARFAQWNFRLLRSGKTEVLRAASLREMQRIQWTDPDGKSTWGLGFQTARLGSDLFTGHSGWCPGYRTTLRLLPQKEWAAVVAISAMESPESIVSVLFALAQKTPTPRPEKPAVANLDLSEYAGRYASTPRYSSEFAIIPWGSDLAWVNLDDPNPHQNLQLMRPVARDAFRFVREDKTLAGSARFERDPSGRVVRYSVSGFSAPKVGEL
jgi:CubicO group peptidase (beta-lactamase class C family)